MLERLQPSTNKEEDHMISSDSFVFDSGNNSKNDFNLLATRSFTRPAFLDLGAMRGAMDDKGSKKLWIWIWWQPGVKKFKTLAVTERVLSSPMAILWITWKINEFYRFRKVFYHLLCHEFSLFLKSKLKDLNSRLEGCGICVLEIYFLNFVGNNEEKGLKWPSAWFCDST